MASRKRVLLILMMTTLAIASAAALFMSRYPLGEVPGSVADANTTAITAGDPVRLHSESPSDSTDPPGRVTYDSPSSNNETKWVVVDAHKKLPQPGFHLWNETTDRIEISDRNGVVIIKGKQQLGLGAKSFLVSVEPGFLIERLDPYTGANGAKELVVTPAPILRGLVKNIPESVRLHQTLTIELDYESTLPDAEVRRASYKVSSFQPCNVQPNGGFELQHRHAAPARATLVGMERSTQQRHSLADTVVSSGQNWVEFDLAAWQDAERSAVEITLQFEGEQPRGDFSWELISNRGGKERSGNTKRPSGRTDLKVAIENVPRGQFSFYLKSPKFGNIAVAPVTVEPPMVTTRIVIPVGGRIQVDVPEVSANGLGRWDLMLIIRRPDGSLVDSAYPEADGRPSITEDYISPGRYFAKVRAPKLGLISPALEFNIASAETVALVVDLQKEHELRVSLGSEAETPFGVEVRDTNHKMVDSMRRPFLRDNCSFWLPSGTYDVLRTDRPEKPVRVTIGTNGEHIDLLK